MTYHLLPPALLKRYAYSWNNNSLQQREGGVASSAAFAQLFLCFGCGEWQNRGSNSYVTRTSTLFSLPPWGSLICCHARQISCVEVSACWPSLTVKNRKSRPPRTNCRWKFADMKGTWSPLRTVVLSRIAVFVCPVFVTRRRANQLLLID